MDTTQAVYDAVRSRLSNCDVGSVIERAAHECFDIARARDIITQEFSIVAAEQARPSVLFKPKIYMDGNAWCALYGEDLQNGVAGSGDSPDAAMRDFDKNWSANLSDTKEPTP